MTDLTTLLAPASLFSPHDYQWKLSLIALISMVAIPWLAEQVLMLVPVLKQTRQLNKDAAEQRRTRDNYMPIQNRSMFWGGVAQLAVFGLIMPFVMTSNAQSWWKILIDVVVIMMFYDFFYYLTHRFLFHDGGFGPGPLMWVHSVHHRQHNPCRLDSSYLHPLETCIGIGLYGASVGVLGLIMGDFHVITITITTIAFAHINLHNHDRMEVDRPPFKYLKYMSYMHHVHHRKFNAGNFATITLLYDWMFGTYDAGPGWGKNKKIKAAKPSAPATSETARA